MTSTVASSALLVLGITLAGATAAGAGDVQVLTSGDPALKLDTTTFKDGKTLPLDIGIGSGAFHAAGDPANLIYTLSDRGPNIDCADAEKITGVKMDQICHGDKSGKIFPLPSFTPSIFRVELGNDGSFKVMETIPLKGKDGKAITGLPNPLKITRTEKAYGADGAELSFDPSGLDTEAIVRLADGSFWLVEEYAPSLVHVAADGRILERLVPAGVEQDLAAADYPVAGALPAILMKRQLNRGIESLALSPDEKVLYFILQNPLANPDADAYKGSRQTRLLKLDLATKQAVAEYVYLLDPPASFANDKSDKQNDVRLSEMLALAADDLVVLERINKTTKLQRVSLAGATNILGSTWDDPATSPSLEQLKADDLAGKAITPVEKTLWLDSANVKELPAKVEGVTLVDGATLLLINDDDFGVDGATTKIVRMPVPATN